MTTFKAKVVSDKMKRTVVVEVIRSVRHQKYGKVVHKTTRLRADNSLGAKAGDWVEIAESRKLAKTKSHKIVRILK